MTALVPAQCVASAASLPRPKISQGPRLQNRRGRRLAGRGLELELALEPLDEGDGVVVHASTILVLSTKIAA